MLFKSRRSSSISREKAATPRGPAKTLPDYIMNPKYESDSELSFMKRMHPTSASVNHPKAINAHGGDHKKTRRGSESSEGSSRLRAVSHTVRPGDPPLKSCLKSSKGSSVATTPSPVSREASRSRRGWSPDPIQVYHQTAIPWGNGLESRRSRHDSAPSGPFIPPPPGSTRSHAHHGLSASDGAVPRSHQSLPPPLARALMAGAKIEREPMKVEQISLTWVLTNQLATKRRNPPIFFDVAFDPRQPGNINGLVPEGPRGTLATRPVPPSYLYCAASTHTFMSQIIVHCPRGPLGPAPVLIERAEGLRAIDLLAGIYDVYHRSVSQEDLMHVGVDYYERCIPHFRRRCEDVPALTSIEERKGLRYVDLLRGSRRRIFKGLKQRPGPGLSWDLVLEDPQ